MYKTIWFINYGESKTEFTYYHFGKEPKFPSWYMEEGTTYEIKMVRNLKLRHTFKRFFQCLFHEYEVR
jgi:hypothetical protein